MSDAVAPDKVADECSPLHARVILGLADNLVARLDEHRIDFPDIGDAYQPLELFLDSYFSDIRLKYFFPHQSR